MRSVALAAAIVATLAACAPQAALLMAALPDGTVPILLSHLERVDDSNLRRVAELDRRADWDGLARFAEENIAQDRLNADWWTVAGYAYSRMGKYSRAVECYSEVVQLTPDDLTGWNLLAQAHRGVGQSDRAIKILNNALLVRRDSPMTFYLLGESYRDAGRQKEALDAYREAVKLDKKFAQAWFGMGRTYAGLGQDAEATGIAAILDPLDPGLSAQLRDLLKPPR